MFIMFTRTRARTQACEGVILDPDVIYTCTYKHKHAYSETLFGPSALYSTQPGIKFLNYKYVGTCTEHGNLSSDAKQFLTTVGTRLDRLQLKL